MKISDIVDVLNTQITETLDYNELSSLNIAALRKINNGTLDLDTVSDNMLMALYDLQEYGLADANFNLTPDGERALVMASTLGGSKERRRAAKLKDIDPNDIYTDSDDDPYTDDYDNDNDELDIDSIFQMNKYGSPNQMQ